MTWVVKSKNPEGAVASTLKDDFAQAMELRDEFLSKGIHAWVEDKDGTLVGFQVCSDPIVKSR